ncbi:MAG: hypothetical protein ACP5UI_04855, partial [Thermoprotei archaeon]
VAKRIANPEGLKKRLAEDGLALSESWLYGDLEESPQRGYADILSSLKAGFLAHFSVYVCFMDKGMEKHFRSKIDKYGDLQNLP